MLIFCDSFDHYATADITKKWTTDQGATIASTHGRRGGGAIETGTSFEVTKSLPANIATAIVGFAYKYSVGGSTGRILSFIDSAAYQCTVYIDATGHLLFYRDNGGTLLGTSVETISSGTYTYIEVKVTINGSTGSYEIRKNGISILSASSQNTQASGNATLNTIAIRGLAGPTVNYDDLYVCDTSGTINNDFLGDIRIDANYPTGDGTFQSWNPSSGSAHFSLVDVTTPDLTDYVYTSTPGNKDTYTFSALGGAVSAIYGVQVNAAALKDLSGTRTIALTCKSGSTNSDGSSQALSTSQVYYSSIYETDPNILAAWTVANLGTAEFGVKCAS